MNRRFHRWLDDHEIVRLFCMLGVSSRRRSCSACLVSYSLPARTTTVGGLSAPASAGRRYGCYRDFTISTTGENDHIRNPSYLLLVLPHAAAAPIKAVPAAVSASKV